MHRRCRVLAGTLLVLPALSFSGHQAPVVSHAASAPARLGPVPRTCPPGPSPSRFSVHYAPGTGAFPAWILGFDGPHATLRFGGMTDQPGIYQPRFGWGHKMLWVLKRGFKGRVTLSGGGLDGKTPLWLDAIELGAPDAPRRAISLEARDQKAFSGPWPEFPAGVTIPHAGCYYLQARWPGGHWRFTFAAGR